MPEAWIQYAVGSASAVGEHGGDTQPTCTTYREVATLKHRTVSTTSRSLRMRPTQVIPGTAMLAFLAAVPLVTQCQAQAPRSGPAQGSSQPRPIEGKVGAETVAKGLEHPWALAFLPD